MKTKNDMCAGLVKLDLDEMINVTALAIRAHLEKIQKYQSDISDKLYRAYSCEDPQQAYSLRCSCHTATEWLMSENEAYCRAVDMLFYLTEAKRRDTVEVIR
jgi:hypothetical protein